LQWGLFWVAFVAQALEGFLNASANVTFRLQKAAREDIPVSLNEIIDFKFRGSPNPACLRSLYFSLDSNFTKY
jgi:hypothetical protein